MIYKIKINHKNDDKADNKLHTLTSYETVNKMTVYTIIAINIDYM